MIRLICLGGTGDAYLVCALAGAVRERHGDEVMIVLKETQVAIPEMFGLPHDARPVEEIRAAEHDHESHRAYENHLGPNRNFYAHPCFANSGVRIDDLTVLPGPISQADMYRSLLGLPIDAPLAIPAAPRPSRSLGLALLIPTAVSWPNDQPAFWEHLKDALRGGGWSVEVNEPFSSPLGDLLTLAASAEMVVGPQCGVMSILVAAEFPCRKVICTPSIDDGPGFPVGTRRLRRTYPYAYVTKFTGQDYDVEEYRITGTNHAVVVSTILAAPRAPRDPRPVTTIAVPLSPGEVVDRAAVLAAKAARGSPGLDRELRRYLELLPAGTDRHFAALVDLHLATYDALARSVPLALANPTRDDHEAVTLNRRRVELRRAIDAELRAPYSEVKDYYGETE